MVFYRKYRPQIIDDLDSAAVRDTLKSVLQKNVPHAFLFTGPKGLGKTSTARIIAKAINCTGKKKGEIEPCNTCDQCLSITKNTNVDILEIDAASNRGIDEIRDLKEKIRLSPVSSLKKVYIIDEVHMLTTEAFNALLKTLEEPPDHAMFILCTTEPQKVPSTILSRCFHISFHLATTEELVRSFKRIVASEEANVDDEALIMIAKLADGGFRDGVKILEEIISLAEGNTVTKELVEKKFQVSSIRFSVLAMLEVFATKESASGIKIIGQLVEQGIDMKYFLQKLLEELHAQLLEALQTKSQLSDKQLGIAEMKDVFFLLNRAYNEMKTAVLPQLPLELALLDWATAASENPAPQQSVSRPASSKFVAEEVTVSTLRKQVGNMKRMQALYGEKATPAKEEPEVKIATSTVELMHTSGNGDVTKEWLEHFWKNLIHEMKNHNHTVAGLLRSCVIKSYTKDELVIQTPYKFHKERLEEMKTRDVLLATCKVLTGNETKIRVELKAE